MGVESWSTDPNSNQYVDGIFIGEGCAPSNLNNANRAIMAGVKAKFNTVDAGSSSGASISALAALTPAYNRIPYYTGPTTASTLGVNDLGATLLNTDTSTIANLIGAVRLLSYSPGSNGYLSLSLGGQVLILQWGSVFGSYGEGSAPVTFPISFPNACWTVSVTPSVPSPSNTNDFGIQLLDSFGPSGFTVMVQKFGGSGSGLTGWTWFAAGN